MPTADIFFQSFFLPPDKLSNNNRIYSGHSCTLQNINVTVSGCEYDNIFLNSISDMPYIITIWILNDYELMSYQVKSDITIWRQNIGIYWDL